MSEYEPKSENIGIYEGGEYLVTAASWSSFVGGHYGTSYEIGIRHKETGQFWLLQSEKYNHQSVQEVANSIGHLLAIKTENYHPEWFKEYMT